MCMECYVDEKGKTCEDMNPIFIVEEYKEYANT